MLQKHTTFFLPLISAENTWLSYFSGRFVSNDLQPVCHSVMCQQMWPDLETAQQTTSCVLQSAQLVACQVGTLVHQQEGICNSQDEKSQLPLLCPTQLWCTWAENNSYKSSIMQRSWTVDNGCCVVLLKWVGLGWISFSWLVKITSAHSVSVECQHVTSAVMGLKSKLKNMVWQLYQSFTGATVFLMQIQLLILRLVV